MNNRKKLKAFTIIELLVVLSLSSLIVSISATIFLNLQRFIISSQKNVEYMENVITEIAYIKNDFEKAEIIKATNNEIFLESRFSNSIIYIFGDSSISRKTQNHTFVFDNTIKNINVIMEEGFSDLVKEITFNLEHNLTQVPIFIRKEYTAEVLINLKNNSN